MRSSLRLKIAIAVTVALMSGGGIGLYLLTKFSAYETNASRVMSGDQKNVLAGHLLEAKLKAAEELAAASVNSEVANNEYRERIKVLGDELQTWLKEQPDTNTNQQDELKRALNAIKDTKGDALEDLFVSYRNIKTNAFNLYRLSWANKWMTLARTMGLIVSDLDNFAYHDGEKAGLSVLSKINSLTAVVTSSALPQASKLQLFGQLGQLKQQVARYNDALHKAEKAREGRVAELKLLATMIKKINDAQGKSMMDFRNEAHSEVIKGFIGFMLFVIFGAFWWFVSLKFAADATVRVAKHISKEVSAWITAGGNIASQGFKMPPSPEIEFKETYHVIDQTMRKVNSLRKEDILVKRLLNVPFVLINRTKQAIFWNSAMCILGKVRALEETGPLSYLSLARFTTAQSKAVDPVERAFTENKEVSQLALLRVGDDGIAVNVVCTPVLGPDHQAEYVMVHIRDLREENKRSEAEVDRQMDIMKSAIKQFVAGKIPTDSTQTARRSIAEAIRILKQHAVELQEKAGVMASQTETMRERMAREAEIKKTLHGRMAQAKEDVSAVRGQLLEFRSYVDGIFSRITSIEARSKSLKREHEDIRHKGSVLLRDLKTAQELLSRSMSRLIGAEEIARHVRSNERMIQSIFEHANVLNANNSILGSRRELTPGDVVSITENTTQIMGQLERSYRFMESSVTEVEKGITTMADNLRESLSHCSRMTIEDQAMLKSIAEARRQMDTSTEEFGDLSAELHELKVRATKIANVITGTESKLTRLVQVGEASLRLQEQLEIGFKGLSTNVIAQLPEPGSDAGTPVVPPATA